MKNIYRLFFTLILTSMATWAFAQPANNECSGAIDLSANIGQGVNNTMTSGPYDNTSATSEASDPNTGYECFLELDSNQASPSLDNTLWFTFTGDGNIYFIEATVNGCSIVGDGINLDDTQIVVYVGNCGSLTPIGCNEDGPNADENVGIYPAGLDINTESGAQYYVLVDGFKTGDNSFSRGEFCMKFTQQADILCNNPNASAGTVSVDPAIVCQPGSVSLLLHEGVLGPNEGDVFGYVWVVSNADLVGAVDPSTAPGVIGSFPASSTPDFPGSIDFVANNFNPGVYYFTLYAFGNATLGAMNSITLDQACTFVSNSAKVEYYSEDNCPVVNILDVDKAVLGMTVFPNPVQDVINLNINAQEQHTDATLMITNITGQVVDQRQVNLLSGANTFDINVSDMPTGVYIVSIESETHQSVTKFVKK